MKVIDLLNKIANREIYTGTHVIYRDKEFIFTGSCLENIEEKSAIAMLGLDNLNNEVEIIEEDDFINGSRITELKNLNSDYYSEEGYYENISKEELVLDIQTLKKYLNKVIDRLIVIDEGDN